MFSDFFSKNRAVYEIVSTNMVEPERTQTIWRLRVAYWISKPTRAKEHARIRASTFPPTHTHTPTKALICMPSPMRARAHTHTNM
jgi:hypothetical protein